MTENDKRNPKAYDADTRLPLSLVPPVLIMGVAAVLRAGLRGKGRYPFNWRDKPVQLTHYIDAMMRHILAVQGGEDTDPGTGEDHFACVASSCAIIMDARAAGTLVDDRPKVNPGVAAGLKAYNEKYKAEQALDELTSEAQKLGLGYGPTPGASYCVHSVSPDRARQGRP